MNFSFSKYLNKILSLSNINLKKLNINFDKNEINLILGKIILYDSDKLIKIIGGL